METSVFVEPMSMEPISEEHAPTNNVADVRATAVRVSFFIEFLLIGC
jgi:hypothetical protein